MKSIRSIMCVLLAGIAMSIGSSAARAADIPPGLDYFHTDAPQLGGDSFLKFAVDPGNPTRDFTLPAGFFGPGSDPFSGTVFWYGAPLNQTYGDADTIVRRTSQATFSCACGATCQAAVPIEIVALNLVSVQPITVMFNGGASSSQYSVSAAVAQPPTVQPQGSMVLKHECLEGGTFTSTLPVIARLTFTKVSGATGLPTIVMDPAPRIDLAVSAGQGFWSHTDAGIGADPPGANFYVGIKWLPCGGDPSDCVAGGTQTWVKRMTPEEEALAKHGVMVENAGKTHVPAVSQWGIAVMTLLVLTAATVVIMRRRSAAT